MGTERNWAPDAQEEAANFRRRFEAARDDFVRRHGEELWQQLVPRDLDRPDLPPAFHETKLDIFHLLNEEGRRIITILNMLRLPDDLTQAKEEMNRLRERIEYLERPPTMGD